MRLGNALTMSMVAGVVFMTSANAFAQPDTPPPAGTTPQTTGPASAGTPADGHESDPKKEEARQRYNRGLQIYQEGNYEAARVEFERAYQLAPSYRILYNIGLCYEQLGDYVQAQSMLKRYLELGAADINDERRREVDKELAQIRPRIARATLIMNTQGVELLVDDTCATDRDSASVNCGVTNGSTRQILLNPGRRRITARKAGFLPETQVVTVAGSDNLEVRLNLKELPKMVEKKSNPYTLPMYIGFGLTAAAAGTAIVTGVLALDAKDEREAAVERFGVTRQELDDAKDKTQTLGTVSDVAWIGTGVFAAASAYFTIKAIGWKDDSAKIEVGMGRVGLSGRF